MTPGWAAFAGFVVAYGASEALRAAAPRGTDFRAAMTRRAGLFIGRALVVVAVIVTGGLAGLPVAALSAGVVGGWALAAAHDFVAERRRGTTERVDAGC